MPSGIDNSIPIICKAIDEAKFPATISTHAIKPQIKQLNVVIQKTFLHLLRFSLPQSVVAILTIARIIKTKSAIENMITSIEIIMTILMEKATELLG